MLSGELVDIRADDAIIDAYLGSEVHA